MNQTDILKLFRRYDAFFEGHFLLTSGLHSPHYFQCARILQHPAPAAELGVNLGRQVLDSIGGRRPDVVLSPALGGLIIGHELGRALGCPAIFAEREEGRMRLRRFGLHPSQNVVVVEDVVTTGGSLLETVALARDAGANILSVCCLVDRSAGKDTAVDSLVSLVKVNAVTYWPEDCPLCRDGVPLVKPGSRGKDKTREK
ncbi:MAG: orotate phosphoribosyltransferase [Gemmatimonadota bacterium]|nr:orotate phosphoribosyltransferase [Gemmatimonadota bacterium]